MSVAVGTNGTAPVESLLGMGVRKVAEVSARRRATPRVRTGAARRALSGVAEALGTIAALLCLTVAVFVAAGLATGLASAGVAILLLDFKVTAIRNRAAQRARR